MAYNSFDNITALAMVNQTKDAYSFNRYGEKAWFQICRFLLAEGFNKEQVNEIVRSKHMRWAADRGTMYTPYTDFRKYYSDPGNSWRNSHWAENVLIEAGLRPNKKETV